MVQRLQHSYPCQRISGHARLVARHAFPSVLELLKRRLPQELGRDLHEHLGDMIMNADGSQPVWPVYGG